MGGRMERRNFNGLAGFVRATLTLTPALSPERHKDHLTAARRGEGVRFLIPLPEKCFR